jgi:hypothetical protein
MIAGVTSPIRSTTSRREMKAIAPTSFSATRASGGVWPASHRPSATCMPSMFWTPHA